MTRRTIQKDDEGKDIINATGDTVGFVATVRDGTAYVDPNAGLMSKVRSILGWEKPEDKVYPLREDQIDTITEDKIRLR
jgi:hypothetical protein